MVPRTLAHWLIIEQLNMFHRYGVGIGHSSAWEPVAHGRVIDGIDGGLMYGLFLMGARPCTNT